MRRYRAVLVGCGNIGSGFDEDPLAKGVRSHAGAYVACPTTELVAVCDNDRGKAVRCAERWRTSFRYADVEQMLLEQQPDIVSICTPDRTHFDILRRVLAFPSVKGILVEKPIAMGPEEAEEIEGLTSRWSGVVAVNYSRRYSRSIGRVRQALAEGIIGAVQTVTGYYTKGTFHNGTHWFDLARWLIGEVKAVWGDDVLRERSEDPTFDAFLQFENGTKAHFVACDAESFELLEMDIIGKAGRVRLIEEGNVAEIYHVADSARYSGYLELKLTERIDNALLDLPLRAVEDLVGCMRDGGNPGCSVRDATRALRIALAVSESARSGQKNWIQLHHE
jgi:predicted dehydrogenase